MAETNIVTWSGRGGISFYVKATEIRGFKDLSISSSAVTEDASKSDEKYVKRKSKGSYTITLTAVLNAALGVSVQNVALAMSEAARNGDTGYFYCGTAKLFPSSFMCTDAKIDNIEMTGAGVWKYCEVSWTLKQASKYGGETSSSSKKSSSKKSSSKSRSKKSSKKTSWKHVEYTLNSRTAIQTTNSAKAASKKAYTHLTTRKVNPSRSDGRVRAAMK